MSLPFTDDGKWISYALWQKQNILSALVRLQNSGWRSRNRRKRINYWRCSYSPVSAAEPKQRFRVEEHFLCFFIVVVDLLCSVRRFFSPRSFWRFFLGFRGFRVGLGFSVWVREIIVSEMGLSLLNFFFFVNWIRQTTFQHLYVLSTLMCSDVIAKLRTTNCYPVLVLLLPMLPTFFLCAASNDQTSAVTTLTLPCFVSRSTHGEC